MAKKILVIEDDSDAAQAIRFRLEANGFEVVTASNGREGLDLFDREKPNLITVDVTMPEMDGLSFVRTFKAHHSLKEVPIVVFTGKDGMRDSFELEGVRHFLVKPCDPDELIEKINSCVA